MKNKKLLMFVALSAFAGVAMAVEGPIVAPEIHPASIGSALTLLLGGLIVLKSKVSRK